jgi:cytoskeleton protein RodZ
MQTPYVLSFGGYLRAIRESKHIALSSVADQLRVSVWQLTLIETENHEKLPDEIYVRGTLKAYAEILGIDPVDIVERYEINRQAYLQTIRSEQDLIKSGNRSILRMVIALGVLSVLVLASLTAYNRIENPPVTPRVKAPGKEAEGAEHFDLVFFVQESEASAEGVQAYWLDDRLHLKLVATSETGINIRIDDGKNEFYILNPRDEMQVEASDRFTLSMGDTGGLQIFLNGKPILVEGMAGQPIKILMARDTPENHEWN